MAREFWLREKDCQLTFSEIVSPILVEGVRLGTNSCIEFPLEFAAAKIRISVARGRQPSNLSLRAPGLAVAHNRRCFRSEASPKLVPQILGHQEAMFGLRSLPGPTRCVRPKSECPMRFTRTMHQSRRWQLAELVRVAEAQQRLSGTLINGLPMDGRSPAPLISTLPHDPTHGRCDTIAAVAKRKETARAKTNSVNIRASHQALCDRSSRSN